MCTKQSAVEILYCKRGKSVPNNQMHEKELIWMANEHRSAVYIYICCRACGMIQPIAFSPYIWPLRDRFITLFCFFFFLVSHCCRHEQKQTPWCVIYCSFMCSIRVVGQPTYNEVPGVDRCANASGSHAVADASVWVHDWMGYNLWSSWICDFYQFRDKKSDPVTSRASAICGIFTHTHTFAYYAAMFAEYHSGLRNNHWLCKFTRKKK